MPLASSSRSLSRNQTVTEEINRRITGDPACTPAAYFARKYCHRTRNQVARLGPDPELERELLRLGACRTITVIGLGPGGQSPPGPFDLVLAQSVLSQAPQPEQVLDGVLERLAPDGLLYVDDFIGVARPSRDDDQRALAARLLGRLSPAPVPALAPAPDSPVTHHANGGGRLLAMLSERFSPLEQCLWSGSFLQRLLDGQGLDPDRDTDLAAILLEAAAILSDERLIARDFLWGVYERPRPRRTGRRPEAAVQDSQPSAGRLEAVERRAVVGWAADPDNLSERVPVDLYVDHKLVASSVADLPRSDLARQGIGDGGHAFRIALPSWLGDRRRHSISALVPSLGTTLRPVRGFEGTDPGLPPGTAFTPARHDPALGPLPSGRVLAGRAGWAFPCDDAVGSIEQLLGRLTLTEPAIRRWCSFLTDQNDELAALGIPYVVAVMPAKARVHPERLPFDSPTSGPASPGLLLMHALSAATPTVINMSSALQTAAQSGRQLFFMRDSGCNYQGAQIAASALLAAAADLGIVAGTADADRLAWIEQRFEGDLAGRPAVVLDEGLFRSSAPTSSSESAAVPDERSLGLWPVPPPPALAAIDPTAAIIDRRHGPGPNLLVLHDPGGRRLLPFLAPAFARSMWTVARRLDSSLVRTLAPSIVMQVLDESHLVRAPYDCYATVWASRGSSP